MIDLSKFVGIPFADFGRSYAGCDCAGLVLLYFKDALNKNLDNYVDYVNSDDRQNSVRIMTYFHGKNFLRIRPEDRQLGDIIVFQILGAATHVGIFIGENKALHTQPGIDSHIIPLVGMWGRRVQSYWRPNE